ncbi:MAG TPA: nuclear transport factor 2 family protein [Rhodothermales bacterium]|nr:nuclear transport factor 2 family protein [Rhodothermales bacterium]
MKASFIGLCFLMMSVVCSCAPQNKVMSPATSGTNLEQELIDLSRQKWQWMADKNVDKLSDLFHKDAQFVHMGGSWGTSRELAIIESGGIWYKHADIQEASARVIGNTAIVLNTIRLLAVVGGREVTNPFEVTEVYVRQGDTWKLASLSFTRLLGE